MEAPVILTLTPAPHGSHYGCVRNSEGLSFFLFFLLLLRSNAEFRDSGPFFDSYHDCDDDHTPHKPIKRHRNKYRHPRVVH